VIRSYQIGSVALEIIFWSNYNKQVVSDLLQFSLSTETFCGLKARFGYVLTWIQ